MEDERDQRPEQSGEHVRDGLGALLDEFDGDGGSNWTRIRRSLLAMLKWCVKMIEDGVTDNENDEVDDEVSFVYPRG